MAVLLNIEADAAHHTLVELEYIKNEVERMVNGPAKRVLILGGYGETGYRLARLLGKDFDGHITLAGRSRDKAWQSATQLKALPGNQANFNACAMDLAKVETAAECPKHHNLLIITCQLPATNLSTLIEGCTRYGTDYIDITPQMGKASLFSEWAYAIRAGTSRFVLDAGANPGLPGWLVRYTASKSPGANTLRLWGRYRSNQIG